MLPVAGDFARIKFPNGARGVGKMPHGPRSWVWRCGEVTERPKVRHWKCRVRVKLYRGFESHPLRFCGSLEMAQAGILNDLPQQRSK